MKLFGTTADRKNVQLLRQLDVFRDLSFNEALELEELLHERVFEKGEIIFEKGDLGHGIFVVISGKVRVDLPAEMFKDAVPEFGPGEMFGELTLFEEVPRFATVVALERTVMVALFRADFSTLLTKNTKIGTKVLVRMCTTICQRFRRLLLHESHSPAL